MPEARLLLVGTGDQEPALRAQVARLGLDERVLFLGVRHDIPVILRAADLAVLPSHTEALPTTLIEAAACGVPAVASDVGGVRETVDDGRTGLVVPPRDTGALAAAVGDLLLDHDRRLAMGRSARVLAEERFDMHAWARSLRREYERALSRRSSARPAASTP